MTLTDPRPPRNVRRGRESPRIGGSAARSNSASRQRRRVLEAQAARRSRRELAAAKQRQLSTPERISGYTDAVFAVVITIMVLELHPPKSASIGALAGLWATVVSYVVSYVFVAIIWINHHFLMGYLRQATLRVIWLNFTHLFFVSLLPFATAWMAQTELARAPVVVYTALFVVTDGAYNLFEREVLRTSSDFSAAEYRVARRRSLTALALFATAVVLSFIQPLAGLSFISLALLLHVRPDVARRSARRLRRKSSKSLSGTAGGPTPSPRHHHQQRGRPPSHRDLVMTFHLRAGHR
jgi:uncharacterized membrane protein